MRILVTGCAGFIGYHFTSRLLSENHEVVGLDNIVTGSNANIADLQRSKGFRFLRYDITSPLLSAPAGEACPPELEGRFDLVANLACPASPVDFGPRRLEILAVCSRGVWNLLDFARERGARFFQTSTSEVYGDPREHPQKETYWGNVDPIGPRSCYDEGKRFAEALLTAYEAQHGMTIRIARIFNTYGPRMRRDDGRALPNFISQALANEPLTVHGDGRQTRSFRHVDDLVEGLWRLAQSEVRGPTNIGNPVEVTLLEVAQEVIRLSGSRSTIEFVPRPKDDPAVRRPDIERAQTMLGRSPKIAREDGFRRTIEAFRNER